MGSRTGEQSQNFQGDAANEEMSANNLCKECLQKTIEFNSPIKHSPGYKVLPNGKR